MVWWPCRAPPLGQPDNKDFSSGDYNYYEWNAKHRRCRSGQRRQGEPTAAESRSSPVDLVRVDGLRPTDRAASLQFSGQSPALERAEPTSGRTRYSIDFRVVRHRRHSRGRRSAQRRQPAAPARPSATSSAPRTCRRCPTTSSHCSTTAPRRRVTWSTRPSRSRPLQFDDRCVVVHQLDPAGTTEVDQRHR